MLTDFTINRSDLPAPNQLRRIRRPLRIFSVLVLTTCAFHAPEGHTAFAGTQIVNHVRDPFIIELPMDPLAAWLRPDSPQADVLIDQAAQTIRQAAENNPGRVITIRLANARYEFDKLSADERQQIKDLAAGQSAPIFYINALASTLERILQAARAGQPPLMLSVSGLPADEATSRSANEITRINLAMKNVVDDVEAFVINRAFMQSGTGNEKNAVRRALPNALKLSDGRPVFYKVNQTWHLAVNLDGPLHGEESQTMMAAQAATAPENDPMASLQAAWGSSDPQWDLNHDGVVDIDDLTIMVLNWSQWTQGTTDTAMGAFAATPTEYQLGTGGDLQFNLASNVAGNLNVVFQVWSDASQQIEAPYADSTAPFVYPAASLEHVTPGGGEVQALIRNENNQVQEIIRFGTVFVAPEPPADNGDTGAGDPPTPPSDGGDPPPPPPSDPPSDGGSNPPPTGGNDGDGVPTNPNAPAPTPVISSLLTTGMAPLTVHVHGLNSTMGSGSVLNARYEWDFGDTTADSQFNKLVGWNVAHVYDQPGTYTVKLRIINDKGGVASTTTQVTVTQPSRSTIYVSPTGNDSANGATQSTPVRTAARAFSLISDNSTVLFKRASTYDVNGTLAIGPRKNVVIGAWGNGAIPVLNWTPNSQYSTLMDMDGASRDITVQDIEFDSPFTPNKNIVMGITPAGTNATVRRCHFDDVSYALNAQESPNGLLALNNTADVIGAYFCWVQGDNSVFLGNTVAGSVEEHNIRLGGADRVYIAHNDLTNTVKTSIWAMLGEHCYIANNKLREGRLVWGPNFAVGSPSERFRYYIAENNEIFDEGVIVYAGAEQGVFRNNVIHADNHEAFSIWGYYAAMNRTVSDVALYNNTAINNSGSYGRFVKLGDDAARITIANNLYVAPNMNAQNGSVNVYDDDTTLGTNSFKNNLWSVPANGSSRHILGGAGQSEANWEAFSQVTNDHYRDFGTNELDSLMQPLFQANFGQALPGVMVDFRGVPRPLTGSVTNGALQLN